MSCQNFLLNSNAAHERARPATSTHRLQLHSVLVWCERNWFTMGVCKMRLTEATSLTSILRCFTPVSFDLAMFKPVSNRLSDRVKNRTSPCEKFLEVMMTCSRCSQCLGVLTLIIIFGAKHQGLLLWLKDCLIWSNASTLSWRSHMSALILSQATFLYERVPG